jgi:hypothetical protein
MANPITARRRFEASAQDVMHLILMTMTRYFDTRKEMAQGAKTNTILIPHSPGHLGDPANPFRDAMIAASRVTNS